MTASAGPALQELHRAYGDRVRFVALYTREAHPGENYPQPATDERKMEHAHEWARRDGIRFPVMVDDVEGTLHRQLDEKPHAAYLLLPDGRVAMRVLWANEDSVLEDGLEVLTHIEPGTPLTDDPTDPLSEISALGTREDKALAMLRGVGAMKETLTAAGDQAWRDLKDEAPEVATFAAVADWFRPLPPLGRSLAALGLLGLAATSFVLTISELLRDGDDGPRRPEPGDPGHGPRRIEYPHPDDLD